VTVPSKILTFLALFVWATARLQLATQTGIKAGKESQESLPRTLLPSNYHKLLIGSEPRIL